jgi:hypothetical protein
MVPREQDLHRQPIAVGNAPDQDFVRSVLHRVSSSRWSRQRRTRFKIGSHRLSANASPESRGPSRRAGLNRLMITIG